ncbi:sirohydrochlorin cobaltochelatase [Vibrio hannami]|uniref:sirohydrochlorin cobaltochelatase n=1 Tax=Vibrio hannami TaxID=2717094 RepID=UPI00240F22D0|nr:sirohydrochlorin cobaltochelatase [Vibrio hannami]MDG3085108.1 sirohydrochlorin cobaltochelatase [Vibrio hannami]
MLKQFSTSLLMCAIAATPLAQASDNAASEGETAIVLAAFGTTYNTAVGSLIGIQEEVQNAYPDIPVKFAFTSNIIRKIWHERDSDQQYKDAHPEIPENFYEVKNILGTLADLQNEGYKNIVVQTTLLTHGEEFIDLNAYINGLRSIETIKEKWKPFNTIAVGRPLMGTWGKGHEYRQDLEKLTVALKDDVELAKKNNSALVYMGHGNDHLSTGLYYELGELMNEAYPEVKTYVGLVEGHPGFDKVLADMKKDGVNKVTAKPLMVVAGDHATNDMAGDEDDSWKVMLTKEGIEVIPVLEGLGSKDAIQKIYLQHLVDAANDAKLALK